MSQGCILFTTSAQFIDGVSDETGGNWGNWNQQVGIGLYSETRRRHSDCAESQKEANRLFGHSKGKTTEIKREADQTSENWMMNKWRWSNISNISDR